MSCPPPEPHPCCLDFVEIQEPCNAPINIAILCQKYSNFELIEDNIIPIQMEPIPISLNTFKYLFYETECFNINPCACNNPCLIPFISLLPKYRKKIDGCPFSLLNEIYTNIEECLHVSIEAIEPSSRIVLNKEISSIKTLCQLHCQSLVNSLRWCDVINIILSDPNYNPCQPLNLRITLVFVSSTQDVKNVVVIMNYSITDFELK